MTAIRDDESFAGKLPVVRATIHIDNELQGGSLAALAGRKVSFGGRGSRVQVGDVYLAGVTRVQVDDRVDNLPEVTITLIGAWCDIVVHNGETT